MGEAYAAAREGDRNTVIAIAIITRVTNQFFIHIQLPIKSPDL